MQVSLAARLLKVLKSSGGDSSQILGFGVKCPPMIGPSLDCFFPTY